MCPFLLNKDKNFQFFQFHHSKLTWRDFFYYLFSMDFSQRTFLNIDRCGRDSFIRAINHKYYCKMDFSTCKFQVRFSVELTIQWFLASAKICISIFFWKKHINLLGIQLSLWWYILLDEFPTRNLSFGYLFNRSPIFLCSTILLYNIVETWENRIPTSAAE